MRGQLRTSGPIQLAVLATERGAIALGSPAEAAPPPNAPADAPAAAARSKLGSIDGELDVLLGGGALEIQAGEQLRRLRVVGALAAGGKGGGAATEAAGPAAGGTLELHLPAKLAAEASLLAASVEIDPKLSSREVEPAGAAAFDPMAYVAAATPDRTPAVAVALPAEAADAAELEAEQLAATERARAHEIGQEPMRVALSEEAGPVRCAVEVAVPQHRLEVHMQDFFARFKLSSK